MGMIYRKLLIGNKKDDLDPVWEAAHFPKRIKKELVEKTNISSSVDKIVGEQLPVVTYRILGFLLLGVTRIYSKKVEYLLIDCNHSLNELKLFSEGRKKVTINVGGMCLPESSSQRSKSKAVDLTLSESSSKKRCNYNFVEAMRGQFSSISLPDNFDLDAFDLEIVENESSDDHVRPHLELVLHDPLENDRHRKFGKDRGDVSAPYSDHASASATAMIANTDQVNSETSAERFLHRFSLDECLDPLALSENDEEVHTTVIEQATESSNLISLDMVTADKEMTSVDDSMLKPSSNQSRLSVTINVTPQSKDPGVQGEQKLELKTLTPASREHVRPRRKRACVFDDPMKIPKRVYGEWFGNASNLIRGRRFPLSSFATKEDESDYFRKRIIPIDAGLYPDLEPVIATSEVLLETEVEETLQADPVTEELEPLILDKVSERREPEGIAPLTPVTRATFSRLYDIHKTSKASEAGPASSSDSREMEQFPINNAELDEVQTEEGPSSIGEDGQENVLVAEKWSAVTRRVGGLLHSNFLKRKGKGEDEVLGLSQLLKHKTKKASARFFSQILVLKTGGYIDVKQEKPYDEIHVVETEKLKEVFGAGSGE